MPPTLVETVSAPTAQIERYLLFLTGAVTALGIVFFVTFPLAMAFVLPLCMVMPLGWYWYAEKRLPPLPPGPALWWMILAGGYLIINASWSLALASAYFSAISLFVLLGTVHVTTRTLQLCKQGPLRAMALGLCVGMSVAGFYLSIEVFANQWVRRLIMNHVLWTRSDVRHFTAENGRIVELFLYLLNRGIAAWTSLLWPTLLVLARLGLSRTHTWLVAGGLMAGLTAVFASDHDTSKLVVLGSATAYAAYLAAPALARHLIVVGWVVATLLVVPLAMIALSSQLYLWPMLPSSAQDRIVFWGHTSQQVLHAPALGVGVNTSSVLSQPDDERAPRALGSDRRLSIRHHPHNAYLQVWFETGAIGALLLCGLGLVMLGSIASAPLELRPFWYSNFVACALSAASSFSLWQSWFMFAFGFVVVFAVLGSVVRPDDRPVGDA